MKHHWISALCAACAMAACAPAAEKAPAGSPPPIAAGADRDAHGCKGSAGYTWSSVRQSCIRIFESGLAFQPDVSQPQSAVLQAFIVLSPEQGDAVTAAELFVPGQTAPIALTLVHTPEGDIRPTVLVNQAEGVEVFRYKDEYILEVKGLRFRRQSDMTDRLHQIR